MNVLHGGIAQQKMHTKQARKDEEVQTPLFVLLFPPAAPEELLHK